MVSWGELDEKSSRDSRGDWKEQERAKEVRKPGQEEFQRAGRPGEVSVT